MNPPRNPPARPDMTPTDPIKELTTLSGEIEQLGARIDDAVEWERRSGADRRREIRPATADRRRSPGAE